MIHARTPFRSALRTARNWTVARDRAPKTLCGAAVTDRDWAWGDAARAQDDECAQFGLCPQCRRLARQAVLS